MSLRYLARKDALLGVATGNLEMIGWIKIEEAGLREWFRFGGFSDHFPVRAELIGHAARKARELAGSDASICVVGDTPRDIQAAHDNSLPVVAVATGKYTFDELLKVSAAGLRHLTGRSDDAGTEAGVKKNRLQSRIALHPRAGRWIQLCTAAVMLAVFPGTMQAQTSGQEQTAGAAPATKAQAEAPAKQSKPAPPPSRGARRRAAKAYMRRKQAVPGGKVRRGPSGFRACGRARSLQPQLPAGGPDRPQS